MIGSICMIFFELLICLLTLLQKFSILIVGDLILYCDINFCISIQPSKVVSLNIAKLLVILILLDLSEEDCEELSITWSILLGMVKRPPR
uniref:Uncharacterized protein n=1 Tax=Panstrongylus lignarius TaxID=156445 RepID=A0A224Y2E2_9HEMI